MDVGKDRSEGQRITPETSARRPPISSQMGLLGLVFLLAVALTPLPLLPALAQGQHEGGPAAGHEGGGGAGRGGGGAGASHDGTTHDDHDQGSGYRRGQTEGHPSGVHGPAQSGSRGPAGARGLGHVPGPVDASGRSSGRDTSVPEARISGENLGRLNAARAFLAPGFDASRIGEEEAESPMRNLSLYQQELQKAQPDYTAAGGYLGNVATIGVTPDVVQRVNSMVGVSITGQDALDAVTASAEQRRLSRKDDEEHGHE